MTIPAVHNLLLRLKMTKNILKHNDIGREHVSPLQTLQTFSVTNKNVIDNTHFNMSHCYPAAIALHTAAIALHTYI